MRHQRWQVALPSEQEWECAARAGQPGAIFPWGETPDPEAVNYRDGGICNTLAVGFSAPNSWGLHDMVGNVWQWTRSVRRPNYADPDLTDDPSNQAGDPTRPVRGGSWFYVGRDTRSACRGRNAPVTRDDSLGFRLALGHGAG